MIDPTAPSRFSTPQSVDVPVQAAALPISRPVQAVHGLATATATEGLGVMHDEIEINARLVRAPVVVGEVGEHDSARLATTGLSVGQVDSGFTLTRTAALLALPMGQDNGPVAQLGSTSGLLYGSLSQSVGNTTLTAYQGGIGQTSATGLSMTTTLANVNLSTGIAFVGTGDATLKVGKYSQGRMQLVYADQFSGSLQLTGGISMGYAGFGMRLGLTAQRSFEFRTWMAAGKVARTLRDASRLKDKLSMLRVRGPLLPLPDLSDPLNTLALAKGRAPFEVGDEMTVTYSGALVGGVAVTGAGVYAGLHVSVSGIHSLTVTKRSETVVSLDVIPKQLSRAVAITLDVPLAAEAHAVIAQSRATRYNYVFDLTQDTALAAYRQALKGTLPGPLVRSKGWHVASADEAHTLVSEGAVPAGVSYELLEQAAVPYEKTRGISMTLPKHLPFANLAGIGVEHRVMHEESVIADGTEAIQYGSISHTQEKQHLQRGTQEITCFGTLTSARRSSGAFTTLEGVMLGVTFANDRTRTDNRNKMVETLNRLFFVDSPVKWFDGPKQTSKYNYEITLKRFVPTESLINMAPEGRSPQEQAQILQKEVATKGLAGLAVVLDTLGAERKDIDLTVNSRAPIALYEKVLQLSALYDKAIDPLAQKRKDIDTRIGKVDKYLSLVEKVRTDIDNDVLLSRFDSVSKREQIKLLGTIKNSLVRLVKIEHLGPNLYVHLKNKAARKVRKILEKWEANPKKISVEKLG